MMIKRMDLRFDQFDYEALGLKNRWTVGDASLLLTSFEMETKGYYKRTDYDLFCPKIKDKYWRYIADTLFSHKFPYVTPDDFLNAPPPDFDPDDEYVTDGSSFAKEDFLAFLEADENVQIDVSRLKRFLRGAEVPGEHTQESTHASRSEAKPNPEDMRTRGSLAANKQWEPNQLLKEKAKQYAMKCVAGGCNCNHFQLGKFIYTHAVDDEDKYLLDGADEAKLSENGVIEAIKDLFCEEKIDRIKGNPGVKDAKNCPLHPK